jgi:MFS transporter, ACDE family, multidrug resistance protein
LDKSLHPQPRLWQDARLLSILAAASLMVMAGAVIAPILPEIIAGLKIERSVGTSLVSLHFLTVAIATPLFGILADRVGQQRLLLVSLVMYAIVGMAGGLVQEIWPLYVLRALLGIASGGIAAAGLGLIGKLYQGDTRTQVIGYVSTTLTLANIVYPLLGGLIGILNWRWAFGLYGLGLPIAVWVRLSGRSARRIDPIADTAAGPPPPFKKLITQWPTLRLLLSLILTTGTVYAMIAYLPLYLKTTIGAGTPIIGGMLAIQAVGAALISAIGIRPLGRRFGNLGSIGLALGLMAGMLLLIPNLTQLWAIGLVSIGFGMGVGLVMPNLYDALAKVAPAELQSSILAAGTGSGFLGQFLSPIVLGIVLAHSSLATVFYVAAAIDLGLGTLILLSRR